MQLVRNSVLFFCVVFWAIPLFSFAQTNTSLPVATTLEVAWAKSDGGEVVIYKESDSIYEVASTQKDARVFGVTALRPALVFSVGSGTVPVVTVGATRVRVNTENGPIARGDLLVSASAQGSAMRASLDDDAVFAVALEDHTASEPGMIIAEIGIEQARSLQESRRAIEKELTQVASSTEKTNISIARASIAAGIALSGLIFILYSFRSTIAKGVVSIGRNPRARTSIMALAFGNIIFALILCAFVIFIAVGVLVLPL